MSFFENEITSSNILDHFTEGLIVLDAKHKIVFASNFMVSLIGFSKKEILEKTVEELFDDKKDELESLFAQADDVETTIFYTELKRKDHAQFTASVRLLKNTDKSSQAAFFLYIEDCSPVQKIRKDLLRKTLP